MGTGKVSRALLPMAPAAGPVLPSLAADPRSPADRRWHRIGLASAALLPAALITNQNGIAELLTLLLAVGYARHLWHARHRAAPWALTSLLLIGLWAWMNLVVTPLAVDPAESLRHTLPWFRLPLLAFAIGTWVVRDRASLGLLAAVWAGTLLLGMVDGLWQLATGTSLSGVPIHGGARLTGPLDRPNIGAFTARLGLPLLAAGLLLLWGGQWRGRLSLLATAVLGVAFVLLTGERTASLMLLLCLTLALAWTALRSPAARLPVMGMLIGLAALATVLVATSPRIQTRLTQTVGDVSNYAESVYGKLLASSLVMSAERPLAGHGIRGFRSACPAFEAAGRVPRCDMHPHNLYAEWLVECGVVGLLGFAAFVLAFGREVLGGGRSGTTHRALAPWLLAALCIVLFPLQATQSFFSNWPALLAWASLGLTLAVAREAGRGNASA